MTDITEACAFLRSNDNFLILMHSSPDGDTIGSGYALCRTLRMLGKKAVCKCADTISSKYDYMRDGMEVQEFEPEHIIAVDVADPKLLGSFYETYKDKVELCIDHHASNVKYAKSTLLRADAAAACEVIYDVILLLDCKISPIIADCLYTGISTDTGCFKFSNASAHTHRVAAELIELGANSSEINRIMFDTKSRGRLEVEKRALDSIEYSFNNKCALTVVTDEMQQLATPDELEGITSLTRQIEGVIVGVTLRQKGENHYKISVRTHPPVNASAICANLGGGGHIRAAGCEVKMPLDEAKRAIIGAIEKEGIE